MLYFIPTPIGNLDDISKRALELILEVETIFCEDTRVTKRLISLLETRYAKNSKQKRFIPFHTHNENEILSSLDEKVFEKDVAFVSDAGMPCISDPGAVLVKYAQENQIEYTFLSGANALLLAYGASGFDDTPFSFFGFLPHKGSKRENELQKAIDHPLNVIFYEAPHRIMELLGALNEKIPNREIFAIKEATKKHEKKFFGSVSEVYEKIKNANQKGEWVVVLKAFSKEQKGEAITQDDINKLDIKPKIKAKLLAKLTGKSVDFFYNTNKDYKK